MDIATIRQGSILKHNPCQVEQSQTVTLSAAKGLSRSAARCFAALSMTGLDFSVEEELSRSFEPCLNDKSIMNILFQPSLRKRFTILV